MNNFYKTLLALIGLFIILSFSNPEKKMEKIVAKLWKNTELILETIEVEKSYEKISILQGIYSEGKLLGYASYSSSHGCKVGGCSAPTETVDDSYEVFDYIIVFDTELNILKVEIENYGGEYGYEICRRSWLKQFNGTQRKFELGKNIDGVSGATVSASYLINDINQLNQLVAQLKHKKLI